LALAKVSSLAINWFSILFFAILSYSEKRQGKYQQRFNSFIQSCPGDELLFCVMFLPTPISAAGTGDAVEGEPCPPGAADPAGYVLRRAGLAVAWQIRDPGAP
jgi:hypothetical protein